MRNAIRFMLATVLVAVAPAAARADGCAPSVCGMLSETPPGSPLVVLRPNGSFGPLQAYDANTGRKRFELPFGLSSADRRVFLASGGNRKRTTAVRYDGRTGRRLGTWTRSGAWWVAGLSANGRFAGLVSGRANGKRTPIVVVRSDTGRVVDRLTLGGAWEIETVSNDGHRLFLIEHLKAAYRVRLYDLARDRLVAGALRVVNEDEPMRGWAVRAVASSDGLWLLTLYVNGHEAFVHALNLRRAVAYCLDLPGRALPRKLVQWALALTPGGRALIAANPALGKVVSLDLGALRVRPIASFRPWQGAASFTNAAVARDGRVAFGSVRALWVLDRGRVHALVRPGLIGGFGWGGDGRLTLVLTDGRAIRVPTA